MSKPAPEDIRAARSAAGLTQEQAAALIGKPLRTWQNWESNSPTAGRRMDAALWELWRIKAGLK